MVCRYPSTIHHVLLTKTLWMTYPGSMDPGWVMDPGSRDPWILGYPRSDIPGVQFLTGFDSFDRTSSETPTSHETFYHFLTVWEGFFQTWYFGGPARSMGLGSRGPKLRQVLSRNGVQTSGRHCDFGVWRCLGTCPDPWIWGPGTCPGDPDIINSGSGFDQKGLSDIGASL